MGSVDAYLVGPYICAPLRGLGPCSCQGTARSTASGNASHELKVGSWTSRSEMGNGLMSLIGDDDDEPTSGISGVANIPVSWGVVEDQASGQGPDSDQYLDELTEAEYTGTELGNFGFLPVDGEELRGKLLDRDLAMVGAFVGLHLSNTDYGLEDEHHAVEIARLLSEVGGEDPILILSDDPCLDASRTAFAGQVLPEMAMPEAQWEYAAEMLDSISLMVFEELGIRSAFHSHCATFVETPEELDILMAYTHPHVLGLCLDTAHYVFGGGDPLRLVERYRERVWHVHMKGFDPVVAGEARERGWDYHESVERGVFCELGRSAIDHQGILAELDEVGYAGWITVEQDVHAGMGNPLECAKRNREFLKGLGI